MSKFNYRLIKNEEFKDDLLKDFIRYQEVSKCWRKVEGEWVLKDIPFIEEWDEEEKVRVIDELKETVKNGGYVLGCFRDNLLIGYTSLEKERFGLNNEYIQMAELYISESYRGQGIGRELFYKVSKIVKELGGLKLYISAHSSEETIGFYRSLGCVDAEEINLELQEKEPCDCQLEYVLPK